MKLQKILKLFPLGIVPLISLTSFVSASANNEINNAEKYYDLFKKLNIIDDIRSLPKQKTPSIGIIDGDYVDHSVYYTHSFSGKGTLYTFNDNVFADNINKYNIDDYFQLSISDKNKSDNGAKWYGEHANTIVDLMAGINGISRYSDIYSARVGWNIPDYPSNSNLTKFEWETYHWNKQLVKILRGMLYNNVSVVNMSLGFQTPFEIFNRVKWYRSISKFEKYINHLSFISKLEQKNIWDETEEWWKNKLSKYQLIIEDISVQSYKMQALYILNFYYRIMASSELYLSFWNIFIDSDSSSNKLVINEYSRINDVFDIPENVKDEFNKLNKNIEANFFETWLTSYIKYLWSDVITKGETEFEQVEFNKNINKFYNKFYLLNSFSEIIDSYANLYNMKIVISAGNSEGNLHILRYLSKYVKELQNKNNKYTNTEFDILNNTQPGKNSKNAIYVGSVNPWGYPSNFSTQGELFREDYPLVSSSGETKWNFNGNNEKIGLEKELIGTSFAAPTIAGFITLLEAKLNRRISIPEIKSALATYSKQYALGGNDVYYYFGDKGGTLNGAEYQGIHENNALHLSGYGVPDFKKVLASLKNHSDYWINIDFKQSNSDFLHNNKIIRHNANSKNATYTIHFNSSEVDEILKRLVSAENIKIPIIQYTNQQYKTTKTSLAWSNHLYKSFWNNINNDDKDIVYNQELKNIFIQVADVFDLYVQKPYQTEKDVHTKKLFSNGRNTTVEQIVITQRDRNDYLINDKLYLEIKMPNIKSKYKEMFIKQLKKFLLKNTLAVSTEVTNEK
ncbi:S8 family serine peptidase [Mycoplasmopsis verecunda]|uniref:Subtilase family protein n=1 Tax=Mycoplasmopsis verecunda TaxID=171291 RepID=A0A1T4KZV6_9BACT|nr:S8 family serine peptidase [Mycoplasmopsis verecunda]WPB54413.1 S8 family serine peptidase [Mycoplasmopsis verecunda]SJZ48014.1 Subtilase family protein [Mycoplasmopsis verecunda]